MKTKTITILAVLLLWTAGAQASLTAVVTPGYQFPLDGSVTPTPSLLNLLAEPTIEIYGTIGGSNTLDPGSVNGVELADSVPDGGSLSLPLGATLGWNVNSPRQLAVNTAGIVDGKGGIKSAGTNALYLYVDPSYFLLATNSLGTSTNLTTGSTQTNWLTLKPNSLTDTNIVPGGLSYPSITTNGLPPVVLATPLLLTNVFFSGTITNVYTNDNTVVLGGTNGFGTVALFGAGFSLGTTNIVTSAVSAGVTNYATNSVPILQVTGGGPAAPLYGSVFPWTNSLVLSGGSHSYTNGPYQLCYTGGIPPYTNLWAATVVTQNLMTISSQGFSTNDFSTYFEPTLNPGASGAFVLFSITDTLRDGSGQQNISQAVYVYYHYP